MENLAGVTDIGPLKKAPVTFEMTTGTVIVQVPDDITFDLLAILGEYHLTNVTLKMATSTLYADILGPFHLVELHRSEGGSDDSFNGSDLVETLVYLPDLKTGAWLRLRPQNSRLDVVGPQTLEATGSEVLFYCPTARTLDLSFKCNGNNIKLISATKGSVLGDYVMISSPQAGIDQDMAVIRTALSLLVRRRVFNHVIRNGSLFSLNLAPPDQTTSLGWLVRPEYVAIAMQQLIDFVSCTKIASSAFHFLIEALSNPATLEVRLLNAMVYLEIIDGSGTLSANALCSELKILRGDADLLVKVRNRMIHHGDGIAAALNNVRKNWKKDRPDGVPDSPFLNDIFATDSPHGFFYAGLMDLLSEHLARQAGIPKDQIVRRSLASFQPG